MGLYERRNILCPCVISSVPIVLELRNYENLPSLLKTTSWSITLKQVLYTYNCCKSLQQEIKMCLKKTRMYAVKGRIHSAGEFLVTGHSGSISVCGEE